MGNCLEAIFCNSFPKCFRKAMLRAFVSTYSGLIKQITTDKLFLFSERNSEKRKYTKEQFLSWKNIVVKVTFF